jgi:hypothetical protein
MTIRRQKSMNQTPTIAKADRIIHMSDMMSGIGRQLTNAAAATIVFMVAVTAVATAAVDPVIGTTAVIGKSGDGSICTSTREKLKAAYDATAVNDEDGFAEAMQGGTQFVRGERVLVIDNAIGSGLMTGIDVRIRILSGPNAHLACWAWQKAMDLQSVSRSK